MEMKIENATFFHLDVEDSNNCDLLLRNDVDYLHIDIHDKPKIGEDQATLTLKKSQVILLRDALNVFINNKLMDYT